MLTTELSLRAAACLIALMKMLLPISPYPMIFNFSHIIYKALFHTGRVLFYIYILKLKGGAALDLRHTL